MLSSLLAYAAASSHAADSLPDITLLGRYLANAYVTTDNAELPPGTRAIRFSTASFNLGPGRLDMRGAENVGGQQRVLQRVFRTDNTWYEREAGWFVYHPGHGHIHFEDWTTFRLRQMLPGGNVGAVIGTGTKTSFCILEIVSEDPGLPGHNTLPEYASCGQVQGLRPGWADVYGSTLTGQFINLTGIPDGTYWLEGYIDPNNLVLETNDANNILRLPVAIGTPPTAVDDAFENNDTIAEVKTKKVGAMNSPNFGTLRERKIVRNLSVTDTSDYFGFKMDKVGTDGDFVRIESPWLRQGQMSLELYDTNGALLASSANSYNWEEISLEGRAVGQYFARAVRVGSTNNPEYWLTIEPSGGPPPRQKVDGPGGDVYVNQGYETFDLAWGHQTGTPVPTSVSLFRARNVTAEPTVVDGYGDMLPKIKRVRVNTVQFGLGSWKMFVRSSAGGASSDAWYPGNVIVYQKGDIDFDDKVTKPEVARVEAALKSGQPLPAGWSKICDMDRDGDVDSVDVEKMRRAADKGGHGH